MTTLTADAIRAMPAGAELDALVREAACAAMREKLTEEQFRAITYGWDYHFRPSSEWRWAMEAAEWLYDWDNSVALTLTQTYPEGWTAELTGEGTRAFGNKGEGPLCVARAIALLALEGKPPEPTP